jgi:hypothetical protein
VPTHNRCSPGEGARKGRDVSNPPSSTLRHVSVAQISRYRGVDEAACPLATLAVAGGHATDRGLPVRAYGGKPLRTPDNIRSVISLILITAYRVGNDIRGSGTGVTFDVGEDNLGFIGGTLRNHQAVAG